MKKILAFILALTIVFCFAGCAEEKLSDEEKLIGKWTAKLDFSGNMNDMLAQEMNLVEAVIPRETEMNSYVIFEFAEDSCKMYFDREKTLESVNGYLDAFENLLAEDLYRQLSESGLDREQADEQFLAAYEVTVAEYAELIVYSTMDAEEIALAYMEEGTAEGVYRIEDGKLYVADSLLTIDRAPYYDYTFDGGKLLLEGASEETFFSSFEDAGIEFPIIFEKTDVIKD